jgi:hypothetical protein
VIASVLHSPAIGSFAPQLSVDERGCRTDEISLWIANLAYDRQMERFWKDLEDSRRCRS